MGNTSTSLVLATMPYICRGCDWEEETVKHFLCECPSLGRLRLKHMGAYILDTSEVRRRIDAIWRFIKASKWLGGVWILVRGGVMGPHRWPERRTVSEKSSTFLIFYSNCLFKALKKQALKKSTVWLLSVPVKLINLLQPAVNIFFI